ncbi:MAG TPA: helix-turn-helix domain-containing protein [Microbacterium sp.]|nr:helix-turn-helix domain-containing protein [Microbacterium sp.]
MTESDVGDLRARRRRDTRREIHEAALDLFEARGVSATTIADIAELAGVSTRTFFRYFSSKEHAALPEEPGLAREIEVLEVDGGLSGVLSALDEMALRVMELSDLQGIAGRRRVRALLANEPALLGVAVAQEIELGARLRARLTELRPELDPLATRLIAEIAVAQWRTAWEAWSEQNQGENEGPAALYRRLPGLIREAVGA